MKGRFLNHSQIKIVLADSAKYNMVTICNNLFFRLFGLIVWVRVVPRRTVVGGIDRRFDNLSVSHHQSHVNCVSSVYRIYVSGQLSRDVIGCFKFTIKYTHFNEI